MAAAAAVGDGGEHMFAVGRHRRSVRFIRLVIPTRHLTNLRVKGVYGPELLRNLTKPYRGRQLHEPGMVLYFWEGRDHAEEFVRQWTASRLPADLDRPPYHAGVSDPPPMEITREGTTFYLAHFNAKRARYSAEPPPSEPHRSSL